MGIITVPCRPYSPDVAPCDFWLFPKLRGCPYETIEEMKEAVMKVIDMLKQEDFHEAFKKLLERHNKRIVAGGDYFEGDKSFMCVLSIKVPIRKKSGNLSHAPRNSFLAFLFVLEILFPPFYLYIISIRILIGYWMTNILRCSRGLAAKVLDWALEVGEFKL